MTHRREELVEVVREVRTRYRRRLAARGALIVLGGTMLALLISASGLETLRFSAPALIAFRLIVFAVFALLGVYAVVRPLRRQVSDSQVAMYLEESNPSLEAAILSAIEASAIPNEAHSPHLVGKLVEQAIDQPIACGGFRRDGVRLPQQNNRLGQLSLIELDFAERIALEDDLLTIRLRMTSAADVRPRDVLAALGLSEPETHEAGLTRTQVEVS